jgi:hypothetical protein
MRRTLTISNYTTAVIACITVTFCSLLTTAAQEVAIADSVTAYLDSHCSACHNADQDSAGVDFSKLSVLKSENSRLWQDIVNNVQRGDMPPKEAPQPSNTDRQKFLAQVLSQLDNLSAKLDDRDFRYTRLTNQQIAWSLKDILGIHRDYSGDLIEDPIDKHGGSLQSTFELSGTHLELYLSALKSAVEEAVPDVQSPPTPYQLHGNDWERQHYLNRNDLAHGNRRHHRRYTGPQWLEDEFQIPLPPNHFFRIYVDDNRDAGNFRVRIKLRNEAPLDGGPRQDHAFMVGFDKGFKSPMHAIGNFTLKAIPGTQSFEIFGNVADYPGVDPAPVREDEEIYGIETHFKYRFITIQNCSPLTSKFDKPVTNPNWVIHGDGHFVRADDQWIDAWGEEFGTINWLKHSHGGSDHTTQGKPAVYKDVMTDTSYGVIERIEFDLPWQWPPASVQPFLTDGKLDSKAIADEVRDIAQRAWRRPLTSSETRSLNSLIKLKLSSASSKTEALRDLLTSLFADSRFLFYSDAEKTTRLQNHELVARLASFLWRSVPDKELTQLANKNALITEQELLSQTQRLIDDKRSGRFISDFTSAWIGFSKIDQIAINPNYYGWWNPQFKHYMKLESQEFLATLLQEDLSCLNCLQSDFIVVNDMMAKYYGIPTPKSGHAFSRVVAPPGRGGILTQPAFLLAHSTGEDSHAVNRGVWVRSRLLGDPPRDPPPAVPALADLDAPDAHNLSTKDRLSLHRKGICCDCHKNIDPWGIAMEAYDAAGKIRSNILTIQPANNKRLNLPVVSNTEIRQTTISGMSQLQSYLRKQCEIEFSRGFTSSMFSFALGRKTSYRENEAISTISEHFQANDHRMSELIKAIVTHPTFRHPNRVASSSTAADLAQAIRGK